MLNFEDWDLMDHEKFPRLMTTQLMHQKKDALTGIIELEQCKWLRRVEKVGLLNLLWVSYYHRALVIIFVIRQLLCLVHDGCLCMEEPIPIIDHLIHRISWLP